MGMDFDVVNLRFVKPLDEEVLQRCAGRRVVTIEDNVLLGGVGQMISAELARRRENEDFSVKNFAYRDEFIPQGNVGDLQREYGVVVRKSRYIAVSFDEGGQFFAGGSAPAPRPPRRWKRG